MRFQQEVDYQILVVPNFSNPIKEINPCKKLASLARSRTLRWIRARLMPRPYNWFFHCSAPCLAIPLLLWSNKDLLMTINFQCLHDNQQYDCLSIQFQIKGVKDNWDASRAYLQTQMASIPSKGLICRKTGSILFCLVNLQKSFSRDDILSFNAIVDDHCAGCI